MLESFRIPINVSLYSRLNLKHSILYRLGYLRHVLLSLKDSGVEGQLIQSQNSLGSTPISRTVVKELQPSDPAWPPFAA
ncbi:hypothetical protein, partial [Xanthomonas euvesicatoria]|uniref:hypothetical protein n=1 Tax=Xanthomonas euvesicatoria TaxID=456327 RepID=UPI001C45726A